MYGPTGYMIDLDSLILHLFKIEKDYTIYGEERFGGGNHKRCRKWVQSPTVVDVADRIITNAIIIDYTGI